MKIVCIICTERLVVNASISVCSCGHLFHEECLFRWFKSAGPNTCPQCRTKQITTNVIKRLFFNSEDITASQISGGSGEVTSENFENLQNLVGELRSSLLELRQTLTEKSQLIEQKETKVKDLEKSVTNTKKTMSENKLLLDYLKKELENYSRIKEQIEAKEATIQQLESKIREYKSIEMIYKDHEHTFANEMNKYLAPVHGKQNTIGHYQTIVRQLVSTNVLLKENADKQMEEKRIIRKRLLQIESIKAEKEKKIQKLETEFTDIQTENEKLVAENKNNLLEFNAWKKKAQTLLARRNNPNTSNLHQSTICTPTLNKENLIVNDTIQIDDFECSNVSDKQLNSANCSTNLLNANCFGSQPIDNNMSITDDTTDLKLPDDFFEEDDDIIEMRCNSMFRKEDIDFDSPQPKRRKNPFVSYDLNDQDKIPTHQNQPNIVPKKQFTKFKSFNELSLSQRFKDSPEMADGSVRVVKPIAKRPRCVTIDLEASIDGNDVPVAAAVVNVQKVNAFSYLSDGFGGRTKVVNKNDKIMPLGSMRLYATKKTNFLTKSKFSK